jgi:hypothetical protein
MTITQIENEEIENELQRKNERLHQALKLNEQAIDLIGQQPTLVQTLRGVNPRVIRLILALVDKNETGKGRKPKELLGIDETAQYRSLVH